MNKPIFVTAVLFIFYFLNASRVLGASNLTLEVRSPEETKVCEYFPENCDFFIKVFRCESGLVANKISYVPNWDGSRDYGVAQLNSRWQKANFERMFGVPFETGALNADLNLKFAREWLYDYQGMNPWKSSKWCWNK